MATYARRSTRRQRVASVALRTATAHRHLTPAAAHATTAVRTAASSASAAPVAITVPAPADQGNTQEQLAPAIGPAAPKRLVWRHNVALAALQLIVGYQLWASGVDKLLYARFPQVVGSLLAGTLQGGHLPEPVVALMRAIVLPNSVFFGFLVEWGEMLAGLGLIAGAVIALAGPSIQQRVAPELARWVALARRAMAWLALGAAAGGALMGLSFYFVDGAPSQWVMPSVAFGGVLDPGMLVLLGCVALLADAAYGWWLRQSIVRYAA